MQICLLSNFNLIQLKILALVKKIWLNKKSGFYKKVKELCLELLILRNHFYFYNWNT